MKLKSIELYNIGPYVGRNYFSFSSQNERNTILVGGRNGAGKTTLLKSVRLGLYGSLGYGFRTNSETYLQIVSDLLNDDSKEEEKYSIKISFYLANQFELCEYVIDRSWKYTGNGISEYVQVFRDGVSLSSVETDDFFELLKSQFAPSLMQLCFFDGEEILKITDEKLLSDYLKDLFYNLFDIDLYKSLEESLVEYLYLTSDSDEIVEMKNEVDRLATLSKKKKQKLESLKLELDDYHERSNELKMLNEQLEEEFLRHGGLFYEQQKKVEREIFQIEHDRKESLDVLKTFIGSHLPFYLSIKLFKQLVNQLQKEREYYVSQELSNKISQLHIQELFDKLNIPQQNGDLEHNFKVELIDLLTSDVSVNMIHNLSTGESNRILSIYDQLTKNNLQEIHGKVQEVRSQLKYLRKLRTALENQEKTAEFKDILQEINQNNKKIQALEQDIGELKVKISEFQSDYEETLQQLHDAQQKLSSALREIGSLSEAEKAVNVIRRFKEKQLWNKVADVEHLTLLMINKLSRKTNFISSIKIDIDTFKVHLYDKRQNKLNNILSAGENQLVILALFWASIKASKKKVPIILDTLLGRLDSIHSRAIVETLIPEFGDQVIVLSTDTEINESLYQRLKKFISKEYTLEYNTEERRTEVTECFFDFSKGVSEK